MALEDRQVITWTFPIRDLDEAKAVVAKSVEATNSRYVRELAGQDAARESEAAALDAEEERLAEIQRRLDTD